MPALLSFLVFRTVEILDAGQAWLFLIHRVIRELELRNVDSYRPVGARMTEQDLSLCFYLVPVG